MKPKNYLARQFRASQCISSITLVFTAAVSTLQAETWLPTLIPSTQSWQVATNWDPNTIPNGIGASALLTPNLVGAQQGYHTITLDIPVTLGNLTMGDPTSTPTTSNGFYSIENGATGSLTFQNSSGNASLQKTTGSGPTDRVTATMILNSTLAADIRSGRIDLLGPVSGAGGLIRSGSVSSPLPATGGGGTLGIANNANSYTGSTVIEHGTLNATLTTDILPSVNSVFGNSATPILVGTAVTNTGNLTTGLTFTAGSDGGNYNIARVLDFSQSSTTGASTVTMSGNGAGGVNTNVFTLSGNITLGTGTAAITGPPAVAATNRTINIRALRTGTVDITGDITQGGPGGGSILQIGNTPQDPNVDGGGAGTHRFSNVARGFTATTNLLMGTVIIAGSVPSTGPSPIGTSAAGLNLTQGNSGNLAGGANFVGVASFTRDNSPFTIRSVFLETPNAVYARNMSIGNGSANTPNTAVYGSNVSVLNGYRLGGVNSAGKVTFSGNISSGDLLIGAATSPNVITTGINLALISANGGSADFTGVINDTSSGATNVRLTINQFRNHPNLDGYNNSSNNIATQGAATTGSSGTGPDGLPDPAANQPVGTATNGTVLLSGATNSYVGTVEVMGGTLQLGSTRALGWGGRQSTNTGTTTVNSGTVLDLNGNLDISEPIVLNGTGIASGGALINSSTAPASIINGVAGIQIASTAGTGSGYTTTVPGVTISGTGSGATAIASYGLTTASITGPFGTANNYSVGDYVNITGGNGSGATARVEAIGAGGTITSLAISQPGSGYTAAPTGFSANNRVSGTASSGTTTLTGNNTNFTVTGVQLEAAGDGYTEAPTYTFDSGDAVPGTTVLSSVTLASDSSIGGSGDISISAVVSESGGARALTKVGAGTLTLSGNNTYTGNTTVSAGILEITAPYLANGSTVNIGASAKLNLNFGAVQDVVNTLFINGVGQTGGTTYGASGSGAAVIDDVHFAGPGVLFVTNTGFTPYTTWANSFLPADVSNPAGDNDNDGLVNQQEFAFGLNPTTGSSVNPIVVGLTDSGTFSYSRYAASGLAYKIFTSTDLTVWTERAGATQTPGAVNGSGVQTVVVTTLGAAPVGGKLFVRVEAE